MRIRLNMSNSELGLTVLVSLVVFVEVLTILKTGLYETGPEALLAGVVLLIAAAVIFGLWNFNSVTFELAEEVESEPSPGYLTIKAKRDARLRAKGDFAGEGEAALYHLRDHLKRARPERG